MNSPAQRAPIAVDAMGGDHGPGPLVEGSLRAHEAHGIDVLLVGDPDSLGDTGSLPVLPAAGVISMSAEPSRAVRSQKDASIVVAAKAVREGQASALFSAGHTGASLAASLLRVGRIKGIARPAVATPLKPLNGKRTVLLDAGANVECQPAWLVQFAIMGAIYSSARFGVERPTVGLVTIGEEEGKGTPLVQATQELLSELDWASIGADYVGNIEGGDVVGGVVDVAVTDGFTGNVLLKAVETAAASSLAGALDALIAAGVPGAYDLIEPLRQAVDPDSEGGGLLLGVKSPCLVGHGRSGADAVERALVTATEVLDNDVVGRIAAKLTAIGDD